MTMLAHTLVALILLLASAPLLAGGNTTALRASARRHSH